MEYKTWPYEIFKQNCISRWQSNFNTPERRLLARLILARSKYNQDLDAGHVFNKRMIYRVVLMRMNGKSYTDIARVFDVRGDKIRNVYSKFIWIANDFPRSFKRKQFDLKVSWPSGMSDLQREDILKKLTIKFVQPNKIRCKYCNGKGHVSETQNSWDIS